MLDRMQLGDVPRKHHIQLRGPEGELRYEECFTRDGFDGPYTILYHQRRPHTHRITPAMHGWPAPIAADDRPLAKRHYRTGDLAVGGAGPQIDARVALLFNDDLIAGVAFPSADDPVYIADGDADQLIYVHQGGGVLRSLLGDVRFAQGDYVFVPRGLLHRFLPAGPLPLGKRGKQGTITTPAEHKRVIRIEDTITVADLARNMGIKTPEVLKKLWGRGMTGVSIHAAIDFNTAQILASEFGYEVQNVPSTTARSAACGGPQHWFWFSLAGGLHIPHQWRNPVGQLRMDAPYSHRDFKRPQLQAPLDEGIRDLIVRRGGAWHGFTLDHPPLDVIGWDGTVYPWAFPILAFQPRVSSVHLPPTWHGTFAARGALICSFVPRPVDFHPEAIPCPYPHSSTHCDEIIFYCDGNFTSRRGVGPGSISHHPMGVPHGPHPGSYEKSIGATATSELAVMADSFGPLRATAAALTVEDAGYQDSFL